MDLLEVILFLVFVGAPLLGRLLQGKTQPPPDSLPPFPEEREEREGIPFEIPAPQGGWSAEWEQWPESDEEEKAEAPVAVLRDAEDEDIHTAEAVSLEPVTRVEAVRRPLPTPVASLDLAEVDRGAEHERFHRKIVPRVPRTPRPALRSDGLRDQLRSRSEVRRAVILAEVLGPPRSLREPDRP